MKSVLPVWFLLGFAVMGPGCGHPSIPAGKSAAGANLSPPGGSSASVAIFETDPPLLTKALSDQLKPGISEEEVSGIIETAWKSSSDARAAYQHALRVARAAEAIGDLPPSRRRDVTITQGPRSLKLHFEDGKLVSKEEHVE